MLLLEKWSKPLTLLIGQKSFYIKIFIVMICFGTIIRLLLCKRGTREKAEKSEPQKEDKNKGE